MSRQGFEPRSGNSEEVGLQETAAAEARKSVAPAKKKAVSAAPEGCSCCENQEGSAATAAVIAGEVQDGEAGLQVLR